MKSNRLLAVILIVLIVIVILLSSTLVSKMVQFVHPSQTSNSVVTSSTTKPTTTTTTAKPTTTTTTTTTGSQTPNAPEDETGVYGIFLYDVDPYNDGYRILGIDPEYLSWQSPPDELIIPQKINGVLVTAIGSNAFEGMPSVKITLPEGLIDIYKNAFYQSRVEQINIPSTVRYIGSAAFYKCHFLKSIVIPEGVDMIRSNTFRECTYLESVTLPSTLYYIGNYAFSQCQTLTDLKIPDGCEVESDAFNNSPNLKVEYSN